MKYRYTSCVPVDLSAKWIKRPMLEIEVFGKTNGKFLALIDSGADCSLFNIQIAQALGIDLSKAKRINLTGISGTINGYCLDSLKIKIDGIDKTIGIPVCFIDSDTVGLLLGQSGFFDKCRIKFEKDHDAFEINLVEKK